MKSKVYETGIDSEEDLVASIVSAAAEIRETPGIFGRVRQSMARRLTVCLGCQWTCVPALGCDGTKNWIHPDNAILE